MFELARHVGTRGYNFKLVIPVCHTDLGRVILAVRVVKSWSSFPSSIVEAKIIIAFKSGT